MNSRDSNPTLLHLNPTQLNPEADPESNHALHLELQDCYAKVGRWHDIRDPQNAPELTCPLESTAGTPEIRDFAATR